jgi:hypothetical protein
MAKRVGYIFECGRGGPDYQVCKCLLGRLGQFTMPIFQVTKDALTRLPDTSFGKQGILERKDLQRLLQRNMLLPA